MQTASSPTPMIPPNVEAQIRKFASGPLYKPVIGGLVVLMGVLLIIGFFAFAWLVVDEDQAGDDEDRKVSPMELWVGELGDGEKVTLDLEKSGDADGFSDVRFLERLLILIPLGGLALVIIGGLFIAGRMGLGQALLILLLISLFLTLFPVIWGTLSNSNFRGKLEELQEDSAFSASDSEIDDIIEEFSDLYSTGEFSFYAFIAFLVSGIGLFLLRFRGVESAPAPTSPPNWETPVQPPANQV